MDYNNEKYIQVELVAFFIFYAIQAYPILLCFTDTALFLQIEGL